MSDAFFEDGYLVLKGTPAELYNLIELMDDELRESIGKSSNIDNIALILAGEELDQEYELKIKVT